MRRSDSRGQVVVVTAVLLIAVAVAAVGVYQTVAIPEDNKQAEFNHDQQVRGELRGVGESYTQVAVSGGQSAPSTLTLGTKYPDRTVFINPPPVRGTLRTVEPRSAAWVKNIRPVDEDVADFYSSTFTYYPTKILQYEAQYNNLQSSPTYSIENGGVFASNGGGVSVIEEPDIIDGTTINLLTMNGSIEQRDTGPGTVEMNGYGKKPEPIVVSNKSGTIKIGLPTTIPQSKWEELLGDERASNNGSITDISMNDPDGSDDTKVLVVTLDGDKNYDLYFPRGYVNRDQPEQRVAYSVVTGGNNTLRLGERESFTVQVRDRNGYPMSGVDVAGNVANGPGAVVQKNKTTNGNGEATFVYAAPTDPSNVGVANLTFEPDAATVTGSAASVVADTNIQTVGTGGSGTKDPVVSWELPNGTTGVTCPSADLCRVDAQKVTSGLDVVATTEPRAWRVITDYYANNSEYGYFGPSDGETDRGGKARTKFYASGAAETTEVYVGAGGTRDSLTLEYYNKSNRLYRLPFLVYENGGDVYATNTLGNTTQIASGKNYRSIEGPYQTDSDDPFEVPVIAGNEVGTVEVATGGDRYTKSSDIEDPAGLNYFFNYQLEAHKKSGNVHLAYLTDPEGKERYNRYCSEDYDEEYDVGIDSNCQGPGYDVGVASTPAGSGGWTDHGEVTDGTKLDDQTRKINGVLTAGGNIFTVSWYNWNYGSDSEYRISGSAGSYSITRIRAARGGSRHWDQKARDQPGKRVKIEAGTVNIDGSGSYNLPTSPDSNTVSIFDGDVDGQWDIIYVSNGYLTVYDPITNEWNYFRDSNGNKIPAEQIGGSTADTNAGN